jgi:site-specific recombinase XerD
MKLNPQARRYGYDTHTFRHSGAAHALRNGADLYALVAMLGDDPATVKRNYIHFYAEFISRLLQIG